MRQNKEIILTIVVFFALVAFIVGATFAFFQNRLGADVESDISVNVASTDVFTFRTGNTINFSINQFNFASGNDSLSSITFAEATLTANNSTNQVVESYYLYLNIEANTFKYTQGTNKPELILTITDDNGNEVKDISSLSYVSVSDNQNSVITGYDITTLDGLVEIFNNREMVSGTKSSVKKLTNIEKWNIKVTFVNYDADQSKNAGAVFISKAIIKKTKLINSVYDVCSSGNILSDCIISLSSASTSDITRIYHHDGSLKNGIDDGSYRYSGGSVGTNNYVCFGSSEETCPTDNLYRIIGVFNDNTHGVEGQKLVKLIKADLANSNLLGTDGGYSTKTGYYWNNSTKTNTWSESNLNTVNLNKNFVNNIGTKWSEMIVTAIWKVGGSTYGNIQGVIPATAYQNEVAKNKITYSGKIGLMYLSDYYLAASPSAWILVGYNSNPTKDYRSATNNNWMYIKKNEWSISMINTNNTNVFHINKEGYTATTDVSKYYDDLRPTFYLNSNVAYVSGFGTSSDPIRIS